MTPPPPTSTLFPYTTLFRSDGNGLFVIELQSGRMHVLDNDARNYNRLAWSEDGTALAVLKGREVERMRERDNRSESTRLNSSHSQISYAVFCLKKKKKQRKQ